MRALQTENPWFDPPEQFQLEKQQVKDLIQRLQRPANVSR